MRCDLLFLFALRSSLYAFIFALYAVCAVGFFASAFGFLLFVFVFIFIFSSFNSSLFSLPFGVSPRSLISARSFFLFSLLCARFISAFLRHGLNSCRRCTYACNNAWTCLRAPVDAAATVLRVLLG
jgi:hypothetical protein